MRRARDEVLRWLRQQVVFPVGRQVVVPVVVGRSWFLPSALMIGYVKSADVIERERGVAAQSTVEVSIGNITELIVSHAIGVFMTGEEKAVTALLRSCVHSVQPFGHWHVCLI